EFSSIVFTIAARSGGLVQVDRAGIPGGDLHTLVVQPGEPLADAGKAAKRLLIAEKLREEDGGSFDAGHRLGNDECRSTNDEAMTKSPGTNDENLCDVG